jgi:hypothetical protein
MSRSRLSLICMSVCAALVAIPREVVAAVERVVAFVFALVPAFADRPAFALDLADRQVAFAGDFPVDAALSHSLRHEAGIRPLT